MLKISRHNISTLSMKNHSFFLNSKRVGIIVQMLIIPHIIGYCKSFVFMYTKMVKPISIKLIPIANTLK